MRQLWGHYFFKCFLVHCAPPSVTHIITMIDHRLPKLCLFCFYFLVFFTFWYLKFFFICFIMNKINHFLKRLQISYYRFPVQSFIHRLVRLFVFPSTLKKSSHHIYGKYFLFVVYPFPCRVYMNACMQKSTNVFICRLNRSHFVGR